MSPAVAQASEPCGVVEAKDQPCDVEVREHQVKAELPGRATGRLRIQFGPEAIPTLQELCRPDGRIFTLLVAAHCGVYAAAIALILWVPSVIVQALLSLIVANQLHALTVLQHDCGHGSAYAGARANLWVGRFLAWFIIMPFTTFTMAHRRHHNFLGDPKQDPDEWFYAGGRAMLFVREALFLPYFTMISLTRYGPAVRRAVSAELAATVLLWTLVVAAIVYAGQTHLVIWGAAVPMALLALVINPISRGYEHYPMTELERGDGRRDDLRFNTVTVTSKILGVMWVNITYHVEHHLYPRVPCHRLPALHTLMRGRDYVMSPFVLYPLDSPDSRGSMTGMTNMTSAERRPER
jgi:fatty acid desaturase